MTRLRTALAVVLLSAALVGLAYLLGAAAWGWLAGRGPAGFPVR